MQFQHVPHLCHIAVFFSDVFFCNLFALNFYPNTSEDKFWNLSISWFSFSGQLEPTIFNYSLAFCLFLMGESCVSLDMYKIKVSGVLGPVSCFTVVVVSQQEEESEERLFWCQMLALQRNLINAAFFQVYDEM